jgi:hypothetical protein
MELERPMTTSAASRATPCFVPSRPLRPIALVALALASACVMPEGPSRDAGGDVYVPLPDAAAQCRANNDGVIERSEVVFVPGVEARYRINPAGVGVIVDTAGAAGAGDSRVWDFTSTAGELVTLRLGEVAGQWFAARFEGGQYAARLDPREPVLGVYRATDTSVDLMGAVAESEATRTVLRYDGPVSLLRFPLRVGERWTASATTVDGIVEGTPVASRDTYTMAVDAHGEVRLGALTFRNALRLRVEIVQQFPAGPGRRRIQYLWLTECYGEVARITSTDGQVAPEFTTALEFRRLGL